MTGRARLVDLSHVVEHGMVTYRGLPGPVVSDYLGREASRARYAPGTEFQIGRLDMVANTGTYLDSPFHRYPDRADVSQLDLAALADLPGLCVAGPPAGRAIGRAAVEGLDVQGKAVLLHTGWARHWRTERYPEGHPFLTAEAAEWLAAAGAGLVGIDAFNIDDTEGNARPAHSILLGAGTLIVEHLRGLEELPAEGFRFFAVPVKVKGLGSFPVRAFARIPPTAP